MNRKLILIGMVLMLSLSACSLPRLVKNDPTATAKPGQPTKMPIEILPSESKVLIPGELAENVSVGKKLLAETFDKVGRWNTSDEAEYGADVTDGVYRMRLNQADYLIWSESERVNSDNVIMDVDVRLADGSEENNQGMICRYSDPDNFYAFSIGNDGWVEIIKVYKGEQTMLYGEFMENLIDPVSNHLQVFCLGSRLILYVNGVLGAEVQDSDLTSGDVGLLIGSYSDPAVTVEFDNFYVYEAIGVFAE